MSNKSLSLKRGRPNQEKIQEAVMTQNTTTRMLCTPMYEHYSTVDGDEGPIDGQNCTIPLSLMFTFEFSGTRAGSADLCFVLDRSGSMLQEAGKGWEGTVSRWNALVSTLRGLTPRLSPNDRVAMLAFDQDVQPVSNGLVPASEFNRLLEATPRPLKGATNIAGAITEAVRMLRNRSGARDRPGAILLLTDGFAWMGEAAGDRPREEAREAMALVEQAGLDFVSMGLGKDWDEVLLNELNILGSGKGTWYIGGGADAEKAFAAVTQQQRDSVLPAVTLEAILETDHFNWTTVRSLLPNRTGAAPIKPTGKANLGSFGAVKWQQSLGNPVGTGQAIYRYLLEATPRRNLAPGRYPIGRFKLRAGGIDLPAVMEPELEVTDRPILEPMWSRPQNPNRKVWYCYQLARIPDIQTWINGCMTRGERGEVINRWREIIDIYHRAGELEEAQREQEAFNAWCSQQNLDGQQILELQKQLNFNRTTGTAPVTESRAREEMQRRDVIGMEMVNDGSWRLLPDTGRVVKQGRRKRP